MWTFDLIELDGDDLRLDPLHARKDTLATLLMRAGPGVRFNEHMEEEDGSIVFYRACKLVLEGIVSKRKQSRYHSGRSRHWLKSKNPLSPYVRARWRSRRPTARRRPSTA
jgi:bifunctional non-homologous end joining protein LigD